MITPRVVETLRRDLEALRSVELDAPVTDWTIAGEHAWPLIRMTAANRLLAAALVPNRTARKRPVQHGLRGLGRLARQSAAAIADWRQNDRLSTPRDIVFFGYAAERQLLNDRWVHTLFDPVADAAEAMGGSTATLEASPGGYHVPRRRPSHLVQAALEFARVSARRSAPPAMSMPGYAETHANGPVWLPDVDAVASMGQDLVAMRDMFRRRLARVKPVLGFVVGYYGVEGMAYTTACRREGVRCIDLQHGYHGPNHLAYTDWRAVPTEGWSLVPDAFWCWSKDAADGIAAWGGTHHQAIVGGHPWHAACARQTSAIRPGPKRALVTFQPGVDLPWLDEIIRVSPEWEFWLRLHPADRGAASQVASRFGVSAEAVREATALPLPHLLGVVDVHLTAWSSTVMEAWLYGVPSVILSHYGAAAFEDHITQGAAVHAASPVEAALAMQALSDGKKQPKATPTTTSMQSTLEALGFRREG